MPPTGSDKAPVAAPPGTVERANPPATDSAPQDASKPRYVYRSPELFDLSQSPLVAPPKDMSMFDPAWFRIGSDPRNHTTKSARNQMRHQSSDRRQPRHANQHSDGPHQKSQHYSSHKQPSFADDEDPTATWEGWDEPTKDDPLDLDPFKGAGVAEFEKWKREQKAAALRESGFTDVDELDKTEEFSYSEPTAVGTDGLGGSKAQEDITGATGDKDKATRATLDLWDAPMKFSGTAESGSSRFSSFMRPGQSQGQTHVQTQSSRIVPGTNPGMMSPPGLGMPQAQAYPGAALHNQGGYSSPNTNRQMGMMGQIPQMGQAGVHGSLAGNQMGHMGMPQYTQMNQTNHGQGQLQSGQTNQMGQLSHMSPPPGFGAPHETSQHGMGPETRSNQGGPRAASHGRPGGSGSPSTDDAFFNSLLGKATSAGAEAPPSQRPPHEVGFTNPQSSPQPPRAGPGGAAQSILARLQASTASPSQGNGYGMPGSPYGYQGHGQGQGQGPYMGQSGHPSAPPGFGPPSGMSGYGHHQGHSQNQGQDGPHSQYGRPPN